MRETDIQPIYYPSINKENFENAINKIDFTIYKGKSVIIKGCSDEKIPISAYHLITTKLKPIAKSIMYGEACSAVPIHKKSN